MFFLHFVRLHLIPIILSVLLAGITFLLFVDVSNSTGRTFVKERIVPYVLCTKWKTVIKSSAKTVTLEEQEKQDVNVEDRIRTLTDSAATIFWSDGSVTRLGEKTNISLNELRTDPNGATKVDFSITDGKTWSNLSRALDPDSSFKERFDNDQKVAAVRGTAFDINLEKDYIHTQSHAITIQDEKGEYITSIAAGKAVRTDQLQTLVSPDALDSLWESFNISGDTILNQERIKQIQQQIESFNQVPTELAGFQDRFRNWIGINRIGWAVHARIVDGTIQIDVDAQRLQLKDSQNLFALYEKVSGLQTDSGVINAKETLQNSLMSVLSEKDIQKYSEVFSRANLYDSWDAVRLGLPEKTAELRKQVEVFSKKAGNVQDIIRLQESLPLDTINRINSQLEEWRSKGIQMLQDKDWLEQNLKSSATKIIDSTEQFWRDFNTVRNAITNTNPSGDTGTVTGN